MDIAPRTSLLDRFLPPPYREAFVDDLTFRDNPILTREARRDDRRRDRTLLLAIALGSIMLFFGGMAWLLWWLGAEGALKLGIPKVLGSSYGSLVFCVVSAVHVWFVMHAAHRRTHTFFLQEYRQNTLQSLLCTPIRPFQIVLQASVYPFTQAMLVAAAGLPFYVFALSLGGVTWLDLLGIYLFYAMISWRPPRWLVPVFAGLAAEDVLKRQRSGKGAAWSDVSTANIAWAFFGMLWVFGALGRGWFFYFITTAWTVIPRDLGYLLAPFPLTWVLWLARLLWTPLPFYAFAVPIVAAAVPLYLLSRLLTIWESSLFLRCGDREQLEQLWDLDSYRRTRRLFGYAVAFVWLGYLWKPFIDGQSTARLITLRPGFGPAGAGHALAGLLFLFGAWAALAIWDRARDLSKVRRADRLSGDRVRLKPLQEALYTVAPGLAIYGVYVAACLLAGRNPFPPAAVALLGPMLAVTAAGALLMRGLNLYDRSYWFLPFVPIFAWVIPGPAGSYLAALSPLAGLLTLTPHTARLLGVISDNGLPTAPVASWAVSAAIAAAAGVLLNLYYARKGPAPEPDPHAETSPTEPARQVGRATTEPPGSTAPHAPEPVSERPARKQTRERKPARQNKKKVLYANKKEHRLAQWLLAWLQRRQDNAVATKEMRVLFRGHFGPDELAVTGMLLLGVLTLALYYANDARHILVGPARLFFGNGVPEELEAVFGGMAALWASLLAAGVAGASAAVCGAAFGKERDKSTLGFVLVTPLSTEAILAGKLLGMLTPTLIAIAAISAWNTLLSAPMFFAVGPLAALMGIALMVVIPLILAVMGGAFGLAAASVLRKDSDASGLSILAMVGFIIVVFYANYMVMELLPLGNTPPVFGVVMWVVCLTALTAVCAPLCLVLARWRLAAARRGDVAFESASV
jgi:hypothetical protein